MLTTINALESTASLEEATVDRIVKLCSEYEPFEFGGGGCPCLRKGLLEIVQELIRKDGDHDGLSQ